MNRGERPAPWDKQPLPSNLDPKIPHHQGKKTPRNGMARNVEGPEKSKAPGVRFVFACFAKDEPRFLGALMSWWFKYFRTKAN